MRALMFFFHTHTKSELHETKIYIYKKKYRSSIICNLVSFYGFSIERNRVMPTTVIPAAKRCGFFCQSSDVAINSYVYNQH